MKYIIHIHVITSNTSKLRKIIDTIAFDDVKLSKTTTFSSSKKVIEFYSPEIVLIDQSTVDAMRLVEQVRKSKKELKTLFYVFIESAMLNKIDKMLHNGVHDYFLKPLHKKELKNKLETIVSLTRRLYAEAVNGIKISLELKKAQEALEIGKKELQKQKIITLNKETVHRKELREIKEESNYDQIATSVYSDKYFKILMSNRFAYIAKLLKNKKIDFKEIGRYAEWNNIINSNPLYKFSIAYFNIIDFRIYNNKYGTKYGNLLIKQTGKILSDKIDGIGNIGRCGADRFIIFIAKDAIFSSKIFIEARREIIKYMSIKADYSPDCVCSIFETRVNRYNPEKVLEKLKENNSLIKRKSEKISIIQGEHDRQC